MKYLYLIRHAKSSSEEPGITDFERKLTERGKADALMMGENLRKIDCRIEAFICSPAKRAKKTCLLFAEGLKATKDVIQYEEDLYLASAETIEKKIIQYTGAASSVALVGHNPGITDFANSLCEHVHIDNMPTGSVFAVRAETLAWSQFSSAKKEFLFFLQPKLM
jgi:phosphohistidine phosphatase